jgi:hypothetical protein
MVGPESQLDRCKTCLPSIGSASGPLEKRRLLRQGFQAPGLLGAAAPAWDGDVTVVASYSLSRVSRSVVTACGFLEELQSQAIVFVAGTEPSTPRRLRTKTFLGSTAVQYLAALVEELQVTLGLHATRAPCPHCFRTSRVFSIAGAPILVALDRIRYEAHDSRAKAPSPFAMSPKSQARALAFKSCAPPVRFPWRSLHRWC